MYETITSLQVSPLSSLLFEVSDDYNCYLSPQDSSTLFTHLETFWSHYNSWKGWIKSRYCKVMFQNQYAHWELRTVNFRSWDCFPQVLNYQKCQIIRCWIKGIFLNLNLSHCLHYNLHTNKVYCQTQHFNALIVFLMLYLICISVKGILLYLGHILATCLSN